MKCLGIRKLIYFAGADVGGKFLRDSAWNSRSEPDRSICPSFDRPPRSLAEGFSPTAGSIAEIQPTWLPTFFVVASSLTPLIVDAVGFQPRGPVRTPCRRQRARRPSPHPVVRALPSSSRFCRPRSASRPTLLRSRSRQRALRHPGLSGRRRHPPHRAIACPSEVSPGNRGSTPQNTWRLTRACSAFCVLCGACGYK